jgi:anti-sigma factor (TIGR02949 family)
MISCQDAVEKVYEYLDGELEVDWNDKVREHIEVCKRCYPYFDFERNFLDHIRSKGLRAEHSEELERKVRDMLRELG